jgi:hypothetical protein
MGGKGAPQDTIFGVIGKTMYDPYSKTLGGLVSTRTKGSSKKPTESKAVMKATEKNLQNAGDATKQTGAHYGQVPYAGLYFTRLGAKV